MGLLDAIKKAREQKASEDMAQTKFQEQTPEAQTSVDFVEKASTNAIGVEYLNKILDNIQDVPTLPSIANNLINKINDPQSTAKEIAETIKSDPALTAKLLKIGNSAYYAGYSPCTTVQNAIARMGLLQIKRMVFSISILNTFQKYETANFDIKNFWKHSIAVAYCTRTLGRLAHFRDTDDLFTAGLLHDLGMLIIIRYMPEMFDSIMKKIEDNPDSSYYDYERSDYPISHCEIGSWLSVKWHMSREIQAVIFHHHLPPIKSTLFEKDIIMFSSIVYLADRLSTKLELGFLNEKNAFIDPEIFNFVFENTGTTLEKAIEELFKNKQIIEAAASAL